MRSLDDTRSRWDATFAGNVNLSDLRNAVRSGSSSNPCVDGLRSVCWKAFLVFENLDCSTWPKTIRDSRGAYASLKEHFLRDIRHSDDLSADPLADDESSPWNTLRRDEILRAEIFQDVERCMPEKLFFREPSTQTILLDILFVFCKLNADVGYRQGMHEVLAPVLWVVSRDAIALDQDGENERVRAEDGLMRSVLDSECVEHDTFTLFCIIMQTAKSFYETASNSQSSSTRASENSPIVERSKHILELFLQRTDPELTKHLTAIDILPQIFVIRWIRLLFGREFPFEDVLSLWDVLFAEDPALNLMDLVCVAMLLRIRWQLLEADYSSALTLLLRYPVPPPPHAPITFVEDALYLKTHLNLQGGTHLISKYTGKSPTTEKRSGRPALGRALHTPQGSIDSSRARSPLRSPSQFLIDSGGIESILQDAAKGAFKRGEKWGSSLRGAIQQIQQGSNSPHRALGAVRWSLDNGRPISRNGGDLGARVNALEERNKSLAKMLQEAMEELSIQARGFEEKKAEEEASALTLTIAKLHFVHVYLENSTMPLNTDHEERGGNTDVDKSENTESETAASPALAEPSTSPDPSYVTHTAAHRDRPVSLPHVSVSPTRSKPVRRRPSSVVANKLAADNMPPQGSPFHLPRPTLAESSFSWMLGKGEDRTKSSFVSASPFAPEQMRKNSPARAKSGFLFGDEATEKSSKDKSGENNEDEDGFTLGTLKGVEKT